MFFVAAVAALLFWLTLCWWRWRRLPPGPWGLPFLGYLPWIDAGAPYRTFADLSRKYGPVYGLRLGGLYAVVLSDVKDIRSALNKEEVSGRAPLFVTHGIMKGYGLICTEGELWKDQRKFVHSCLRQFGAVKASPRREHLEGLILKEVNGFVEYVKGQGDGTSTTLEPLEGLRHFLGSVMNKLTFGKSWSMDDPTWKWLQHLQEEGTKHIGVSGPLNFLPVLRFVPKFKRTMDFLMDGKLRTHEHYKELIREEEGRGCEVVDNVIRAFLRERRKREGSDSARFYCDQQFYHILADFFGAGLDTTLTTVRWYLLYMAAHPAVQSLVQEELDHVTLGRPVSLEHRASLPLAEASLAEAQRIRPVVPLGIPHGTVRDTEIGGFGVPGGAMVVPLQWAVHMDPLLWEDPERFEPRRFLDEEGRFFRPEGFLPFQTGKRMCVGEELARMLLFLFGATILQRFSLSVSGPVDFEGECGITLTPKPHEITFRLRSERDQ